MREWIRRKLPTEESIRGHPALRWLGPLLRRPWLWHLNRRRVALGAGIGVFFGFMVPVLQIAGAAVFALLLRANLPVAALATLVSNPVTYAPIFVLAYKTGAAVLGEPVQPGAAEALAEQTQAGDVVGHGRDGDGAATPGWIARVQAIGKPLFLGLALFAVVGGLSAWALVHVAWTVGVWVKRRRRRRASVPLR
jgi:uncharacterized protein